MNGSHQGQPIIKQGAALGEAQAAMILIHGRGASAESILELTAELERDDFAYWAPQAADSAWYPNSFLAPVQRNEPGLTSGLARIDELVQELEAGGIPRQKIILLGFSQGACLVQEFAARHPARYGGLAGLSGGLIGVASEAAGGEVGGSPDGDNRFDLYSGNLDGTPIFLGCSDIDPHIPKARVDKSQEVFQWLGATVEKRIYSGMGHTINWDEIAFVSNMMEKLTS